MTPPQESDASAACCTRAICVALGSSALRFGSPAASHGGTVGVTARKGWHTRAPAAARGYQLCRRASWSRRASRSRHRLERFRPSSQCHCLAAVALMLVFDYLRQVQLSRTQVPVQYVSVTPHEHATPPLQRHAAKSGHPQGTWVPRPLWRTRTVEQRKRTCVCTHTRVSPQNTGESMR